MLWIRCAYKQKGKGSRNGYGYFKEKRGSVYVLFFGRAEQLSQCSWKIPINEGSLTFEIDSLNPTAWDIHELRNVDGVVRSIETI